MNPRLFEIRRAEPEDAAAVKHCIEAAYAQYLDRKIDLPPVSEGIADDIARGRVWVAVIGEVVVAGLVLVAGEGNLKLANIAVDPAHAGKGIGGKLLSYAERQAIKQGFNEMRLNTHAALPENIQLYGHLGWEETSRRGSTVTMRKILNTE